MNLTANLAKARDLGRAKVAVLQYHFDNRLAGMGRAADPINFVPYGIPIFPEHFSDIHNHVELSRAVVHAPLSLEELYRRRVPAVRKPDSRSHIDPGSFQD